MASPNYSSKISASKRYNCASFLRQACAMQHVVEAEVHPRGLDGDNVVRLLDHAHHRGVATGIRAERAQLAVADVVAGGAQAELVLDVENRLREVFGIFPRGAEDVESKSLRGLLPDA